MAEKKKKNAIKTYPIIELKYIFISSSSIDELYKSGVDISSLVPKIVLETYAKVKKETEKK